MSDIYSMRWTTPLYGYGLVYHVSVIVLLDMSKAFDSIRHDLLINKLYKLGVSFAACSWFLSYLSQRMQVVKIEDFLSELLPLKAGVPQGSILGPVLFTLYVNDLLQVPKRCRALGYVDDTKILRKTSLSFFLERTSICNFCCAANQNNPCKYVSYDRSQQPCGKFFSWASPIPLGNFYPLAPHPLGISINHPWGGRGVWIFSGTTQFVTFRF